MTRDPHLALLDDARHADAVAERQRRRHLFEADEADATLRATLQAIADERGRCAVVTALGDRRVGRLEAVLRTHCRLVGLRGTTWVHLDHITVASGTDGRQLRPVAPAAGRSAPRDPAAADLVDDVPDVAGPGATVLCRVTGGHVVRGRLLGVGQDVLRLRDVQGTTVLVVQRHVVELTTDCTTEDG